MQELFCEYVDLWGGKKSAQARNMHGHCLSAN